MDLLVWAGSLFVLGSAVIHFHLWDSLSYRAIPTIGPLFLMQAIVGAVLAILTSVAVVRWAGVARLLIVVFEAGFIFSTAGGLIISVNVPLFGWQETMGAPYVGLALAVEFTAGALLLAAAAVLALEWLAGRKDRPAPEVTKGTADLSARAENGDGPPGPGTANRPVGSRQAPRA